MPVSKSVPSSRQSDPALSDQLAVTLEKLRLRSEELNGASDELAQAIAPIEAVLKTFNLGIVAWFPYDSETDSDGVVREDYVGYAKMSGKWGLTLSRVFDQQDSSEWPFNDAPRAMRVAAVLHIPALLDKLAEDAGRTSEALRESAAEARGIASTLATLAQADKAGK